MHPPCFNPHQRLSDWPECRLELRCHPCAGRSVYYPLRLLAQRQGDVTFAQLLGRLTCNQCGRKAAPVYLLAGFHREFCGGSSPDWALELVPARS